MKMTKTGGFKKLALGVVLACGVNGAQAATLITNLNDVFLSVWDATSASSYTLDLGVDINTFGTTYGASDHSWALDSVFSGWTGVGGIAHGNQLAFNVAGVNQIVGAATARSSLLNSLVNSFNPLLGTSWPQGGSNYFTFLTEQNNVLHRINDLNLSTSSELVTDPTVAAYFVSPNYPWGVSQHMGQDQSSYVLGTVVDPGLYNHLNISYVTGTGSGTVTNATQMATNILTGFFSLDVANSTLNWTSTAVTAVPVPGAVWLFMGGLLSMLGLQKRKSAVAA